MKAGNNLIALFVYAGLILILLACIAYMEARETNAGLPLVKSSAAQGGIARANTLFAPCPLAPQNLPKIVREERA